MAQPLIKFFRVATLPAKGVPGALYFVSGEGVLYVCTGETSFEAYSGARDASLNGELLTIVDRSGNNVEVNLANYVKKEQTIAGIDLQDNITAEELKAALGLNDTNLGGEANVLEGVKVNGEALTIAADKTVDILVAEGSTNGTIAVNNKDFAVHGLGSAAYTTVAALESTMDSKDQAIAAAAATDAQNKADKALADAKTWVEEQEYVTAAIINGLATEQYVNDAVKAEADIARAAEKDLADRLDIVEGEGEGSIKKAVADAKAAVIGDATEAGNTLGKLEDKIQAVEAAAVSVKEGTINHVKVTKAGTEYTVEGVDIASKAVVDTLVGEDKDMSARAIVQDEVAKQLTSENISDSFDTLKEMAEWLSSHPADVKEMNDAIGANKTAIEAEVLRATTAEGNLQTAIDNEESARKAAIEDLYFNDASTGGSKVTVNVTQVDGKITGVTVAETDIASAQALATLDAEVQEHEEVVAAALVDLKERIDTVSNSIPTELGVMSVSEGTDGNFVTTTVDNTDAANPKVSVAVAYVDGTTAGNNLTTNTYVDEHIAAAINAIPAAHVTDVVGDSASYSVVEAPEAGGVHTVKNTLATITVDDNNVAAVTEGLATDSFVKTYVENQLSWASF